VLHVRESRSIGLVVSRVYNWLRLFRVTRSSETSSVSPKHGVFDATGRTVRTLASGHQKAGFYSVNWDSRDSHGKQVPYGVYFYRLDTPGFRAVKKAVVAR
jgi:hypothetical protein